MPQSMENQELELEQEQDKTYHKSIDALIEDVEIEAEIEAEKKIRSKNARLFTIALAGIALVGLTVWQVSKTASIRENTGAALPELTKAQSAKKIKSEDMPDEGTHPNPYFLNGLADDSDSAVVTESAPVGSKNPEPLPESTAKVEPDEAKSNLALPLEKLKETEIAKALPKEPTPKAPVVVPQLVKTQAPATPVKEFFVQLGTFSVEDNAKNFIKQIEKKGFKPTTQIKSGIAKKHIVFVGGFPSKESGSQALSDLKSKGFDSAIEKLDDNSYTIVLGKFTSASEAETLRDKLSLEGFLSSTKISNVSRMIYTVQLGAFDSLPQAKVMQKKIGRAGFNDSFIR